MIKSVEEIYNEPLAEASFEDLVKKDLDNCQTTEDVKKVVSEKLSLMKTRKEKIKYLQKAAELLFKPKEKKANR